MSTVPHTLEPVHFSPQTVYCGDCEEVLAQFPTGCADLIYIDPPFNSNRNYEVFWGDVQEKRAFDDRYGDAQAYIAYMRPRVEQLYRVLKPTGSFYYHCDWHASHYIKVMLDEIFGFQNFQNEIIWKRQNAHNDARKRLPMLSDSIYYYSKSSKFVFNAIVQPHTEEYIADKYKHVDEDGRYYTLDNMTSPQPRPNMMYEYKGFPCPQNGWRYSRETMERLDAEGRIWFPNDKSKRPRLKRFLDEQEGTYLGNLWYDIPPLNSQAAERLGYPTQKPLALMERIINASSNPGDIVLDAFCGCGTTLVAARQLGRRFVGIDISPSSCNVMGRRLEEVCGMRQAPPSLGVEEIAASWDRGLAVARTAVSADIVGAHGGTPHGMDNVGGQGRPPHGGKAGRVPDPAATAYYRFSNLPRSAEVLRKLPGFEFENWAVLQLGEVLKHHGRKIRAQVNRAKVGDFGLDGKIYLVSNASIKRSEGKGKLFSEVEDYVPIQVKNKDKVGRPDIDSFAHALRRDERRVGFFIGWEFTKDAAAEVARVARLDEAQVIIPVPVQQLIAETFDTELLALAGR